METVMPSPFRLTIAGLALAVGTSHASAQSLPAAVFSPFAIASAGIAGWIDYTRDDPKAWKRDAGGFFERVGSRFGQNAVQTTTIYTGALLLRQDARYRPCQCSNLALRIGHALVGPLTATSSEGNTVLSPLQPVGAFAGAYTAMAWRPGRYDAVKGYQFALTSLAGTAAFDLVRELFRRRSVMN